MSWNCRMKKILCHFFNSPTATVFRETLISFRCLLRRSSHFGCEGRTAKPKKGSVNPQLNSSFSNLSFSNPQFLKHSISIYALIWMNHFLGEAFLNLGTPYLFREIGGQPKMTANSFELRRSFDFAQSRPKAKMRQNSFLFF